MLEIIWHGRGGQGAVTAAKLLAEAALLDGKYIQAFPEFGAERSGAPVRSFTRISDAPIRIHCQIKEPDAVVVLDSTLLGSVDVCAGLSRDGIIIINIPLSPSDVRKKYGIAGHKVFTVDATSISIESIGKNIPNMPMVGALIKASKVMNLEALLDYFKKAYSQKFSQSVVEGNAKAIRTAYERVIGE